MEELVVPYDVFKQQGYDVTVASIKGGEIPVDEASLNPPFATKEVEEFILSGADARFYLHHHVAAAHTGFSYAADMQHSPHWQRPHTGSTQCVPVMNMGSNPAWPICSLR
jgi:hypothetical protein